MRNLKKLLSVVLVVAMIASLCAVGSFSAAAAEYSEVTNYKEAAAVITGVGVMDGYEDGTMQYDKTVTREEAAAIICRALIGVDTAKKLSTAVAPFADVAANRWSAPYINYLKAQGIVNGKSATQFDPTAEVTGVEFAKMMLCAVGYGKANEFVGASWDVNTITAANNNGVYTGTLATDLTAPATREQCMLYAFNTMTRVPVVSYNSAFQSYYVGTSVVSNIDSRVAEGDIGVKATNYDYTLAYRNFKLERNPAGNDDYGRTSVKWTADGKAVVEEVCSVAPDYVLYGTVNSDVLYKNLGKAVVNDINANYARFTAFVNGEAVATPITVDIKSGNTMQNILSGNGDTVELYVSTNGAGVYSVKAVVIKQYFAQVTKIDTSANKLYATIFYGYTDYTIPAAPVPTTVEYANCVADGDDVNITGLKKDDYILVNAFKAGGNAVGANSTITAIATPKTAIGTYNGTTFMGLARDIDGNMTFENSTMVKNLDWSIGNQYTYYYDSLGNVIYSKFYDEGNATGSTSYFYVVNAQADDGTNILSGSTATLALDVVYANGGKEIVKVAVNKDNAGKYVTITSGTTITKYYFKNIDELDKDGNNTDDIADFIGKFFSYTKNSDGFVKLTTPNATYATADNAGAAYDTTPGKTTITGLAGGFTATSSTVLTLIDVNGNVATYTGYANFPKNLQSTATIYKALYTYASNSKKLKSICLYNTTGTVAAESNLALCGGFWSHTTAGDIAIFYVDGEYKMLTFDTNNSNLYTTNNVYELTISDSGNTATKVTDYYTAAAGNKYGVVNASNGMTGGYATGTNLKNNASAYLGLGHVNPGNYAIDEYYAWAIIDDVDGNVFTTKAVKANLDAAVYTHNADINASTYYFNSNTKIYDCRNNTCTKLTELPTNVAFIAYVNEDLYSAVSGVAYCEYIWIVG